MYTILFMLSVFCFGFCTIGTAFGAEVRIIPQNPAGGQMEIAVSLSDSQGVAGYTLRLDYDEKMLTAPQAVTENTLSAASEVTVVKNPGDGIGKCSVSVFRLQSYSSDTLLRLRFTVSPAYSSVLPVPVRFVSPNRKTVLFDPYFDPIDSIFIPIAGDSGADGSLGLEDAVIALRTVAGDFQNAEKGADVNGDDRIGLEEAIYVLRILSGLSGK
ncbi:MAG: hypothetical protein V2I97_16815 [Desulfococcaceae bacterium]|jgi:hypothetical protein|nr:hypothetical protein [Desulfococcaceae bacterium]